jgi:uncharacterized protein (DUF488 family)
MRVVRRRRPLALLCTIGYEGYATTEWFAALRGHGVETVIDVRDLPLSRKRGFSKSQLRESLEGVGIDYLHIRALGNPRQYREALHQGMAFSTFAGIFSQLLDDQRQALEHVLEHANAKRVCLLCYEEDPARCHRSLVAERVRSMGAEKVEVVHLRNERAA